MHSSWESGGGGEFLGFFANSFEGGTWGCEKLRRGEGRVLLHFYVEVFQKSLYGVHEVPPPPSPPPPQWSFINNFVQEFILIFLNVKFCFRSGALNSGKWHLHIK
jgi:hypothetical protein